MKANHNMVDKEKDTIRYNGDESRAMGYCGELEFPLSQAGNQFYKLMKARTIRLDTARATQGLDTRATEENTASLEVLNRIADELLPIVMVSLMDDIDQYLRNPINN